MGMFGLLNIDKPPGPTSHDVVDRVRRMLGRRIKLGHAGTLDPFASGVLVLCVGPATRLAEYVQAQPKRYLAEVTLGASSATDDPEGPIEAVEGAVPPDERTVRQVLRRFVGQIEQRPPAHCAVHVDGRRAYRLARSGKQPNLTPRTVQIHAIELLRYEYPRLTIDVRCGRGTYIRALARDIGEALSIGGYCSSLTRTAVGPFLLEDARPLDRLDPRRDLLSPLDALVDMEHIALAADHVATLAQGRAVTLDSPLDAQQVAVTDQRDQLVAIARVLAGGVKLRPLKVFTAGRR